MDTSFIAEVLTVLIVLAFLNYLAEYNISPLSAYSMLGGMWAFMER